MDRLIDWRTGIDTLTKTWSSPELAGRFEDANQNISISYFLLFQFLGRMAFKSDDVFYDIGCGNGRVLCYVARKRVSKVVGIELSQHFSEIARTNAKNMRGRSSPVEVRCGDASNMDYSDGTIFFLYNPFGADTLQSVIENIQKTITSHRRAIIFIYINPVHSSVFRLSGWLECAGSRQDIMSKQQMELWVYEG